MDNLFSVYLAGLEIEKSTVYIHVNLDNRGLRIVPLIDLIHFGEMKIHVLIY